MNDKVDLESLKKVLISRFFFIYFILGLLFFLPAGILKF